MAEPQIDDLVTASRMREPGVRRQQAGTASLGWYRGEQSAHFEDYKLLKRWGFTRIADRLRKHWNLDKRGNISP